MKYLITGGAGYLGQHLCEKLSGHELVVIDKLIYDTKRRWSGDFVFIEDDIKNIKKYEKHFDGVDTVFHLASPRLQDISKTEISDCLEDLKMLYDVSVKNNIRKFIFPSSCSVYGFRDKKVTEEDEVNLTTYYSELKYKSELVLNEYNEISTMLARQATLFGVSKLMRNDLMINNFVKSIKEKKSFEVYGKDTWRPNLYVSDCADILLKLLHKDFEGTINVGFDELNLSKQNVIDEIPKALEMDISEYVSYANNEDDRSYRVNFSKLEELIDDKFVTLNQGIKKLWENLNEV